MAICKHCGKQYLKSKEKFCSNCGELLEGKKVSRKEAPELSKRYYFLIALVLIIGSGAVVAMVLTNILHRGTTDGDKDELKEVKIAQEKEITHEEEIASDKEKTEGFNVTPMLSAGEQYSLALKSDGTVWAWGSNRSGQLGDGTGGNLYDYKAEPVQVSGLSGAVAVSAGSRHSLAVKEDGTVWAWGYNGSGQLGDGTTDQRFTPVQVSGLSGILAVSAGNSHSLAVKQDGTVWAWGANWSGLLGDGTNTDRYTPVRVSGSSDAVAVSAGGDHSLGLRGDGTVWAWGYSGSGQLGDGSVSYKALPVQSLINLGRVTPSVEGI